MDPMQHQPINVLCVLKGFDTQKLKHKITPYRVERENGRTYQIREVRHCTRHRFGKTYNFQYVVRTKDDYFLEIWFDGQSYTWRLTLEVNPDGIETKY
jgi:hypothetical protein